MKEKIEKLEETNRILKEKQEKVQADNDKKHTQLYQLRKTFIE